MCVSIANTYEAIAIPVLFMVWFGVLMPPPPLLLNGSILMFTFCFSFSLFVHLSTCILKSLHFFHNSVVVRFQSVAVFWVILRARPFCLLFTTLYTACMCASVLMFWNKIKHTYIYISFYVVLWGAREAAWRGARHGTAYSDILSGTTVQYVCCSLSVSFQLSTW